MFFNFSILDIIYWLSTMEDKNLILSSSITTPVGTYTLLILSPSLYSYVVISLRTKNIMTMYAI